MAWAAALAAVIGCAGAPAEAQLKFATVSPPGGPLNTRVLHPWADKVNASGEESVQLDVRDGYTLGNFANIYDRVMNDVVQVASGLQGTVAGKFPLTNLISLPMLFDRSDLASVAFWRLYKSGALDSEYDEVIPLYVAALAQSGLHFARAPDSPTDLKGAKVLSTSKIVGESVEAIGGTPVSLQLTDMYPALQRRAVDAVVVAWTAFPPFKLGEVTNHHIDAALGSAPAFIFMAKKKFAALPAAGQKALMDASGEAQSRAYGAYWMALDAEGRKDYEGKPGHTIVTLTPAQTATYRARLQHVVDGWIAATPGSAKAVAEFKTLLAEVK
jgi:TRAP-type C4-dicarboxylate transport system substrate-binding protein